MYKKLIIAFLILFIIAASGFYVYQNRSRPPVESKFVQNAQKEEQISMRPTQASRITPLPQISLKQPGNYALLENSKQVYQTFNNCGPATLSMILAWYGVDVSQSDLSLKMRPYQNPKGDNDDKTIFTYEFVDWARKYNFEAVGRVNGNIELLKKFVANGIPVVVKTWLKVDEDIGHFRLVKGFDEEKKVLIQDDSYQGPNKKIPYFDFLSMWQSFNYAYIIVYTPQEENLVKAIIAKEMDEQIAWGNSLERAKQESELDQDNVYPWFNMSTAYFHLGEYRKSVEAFEKVESRLPRRMLWYQIEPVRAYKALGNYQRVFEVSDNILNNGNRAFSELYQIRGEIYLEEGNAQKAKEQFQLAVDYNQNFEPAKKSLEEL